MLSSLKAGVRSVGPLYRVINRARGSRIHEPSRSLPGAARIGSDYGGWVVDLQQMSAESVVYAVGVGEDITFDLGLIAAIGCNVHAFDPTPGAVKWVERQSVPAQFHFHPVGLGSEDGEAVFQIPPVDGNHSYSLTADPSAEVRGTVNCEIRRLGTIMQELGHDRIDLLKMDIEGFEYSVIDDIIDVGIRPQQLLIEFHHNMYTHGRGETDRAVAMLKTAGYDLFWVSDVGHEYAFIFGGPTAR